MIINILLLLIILFSLGGIIFIIARKFFSLANIDLSQLPEERIAKAKRDLLERKIGRQIGELNHKLKTKLDVLKLHCKKGTKLAGIKIVQGFDFLKREARPKIKKGLIFLRNKIEFVKNKIREKKMLG